MRLRARALWLGVLAGCGGSDAARESEAYDVETLEAYLRAIPDQERLLAGVPTLDEPGALRRRGDAVLAAYGIELARAINRPVRALVATLRAIVHFEPTRFDAVARSFVWGPWENTPGSGQVALVVTENDPGADFQYAYVLLRTSGDTLQGGVPVIAGGSTPDVDDPERGVGVALWDVGASRQFDIEHGADADTERGSGRFVTLFGHELTVEGESYFNLAVFRDFVAADATDVAEPLDADYFYGRFDGDGGLRLDFVDGTVSANICGASVESCFDGASSSVNVERFDYDAFFVNGGLGRAEARLSEGDLEATAHFVECWSPGLERTSFQIEGSGAQAGVMVETLENGSCSAPADQSAAELGIPTLDDVDPALLDLMSCAAKNELVGCE